jgi:hypothetical protein
MTNPNTITTAQFRGNGGGWGNSEFLIPNSEFNPAADLRKSAYSGNELTSPCRLTCVLLLRVDRPLVSHLEVRFGFAAIRVGAIANYD